MSPLERPWLREFEGLYCGHRPERLKFVQILRFDYLRDGWAGNEACKLRGPYYRQQSTSGLVSGTNRSHQQRLIAEILGQKAVFGLLAY